MLTQAEAAGKKRQEYVKAVMNEALALFQQGKLDSAEILFATVVEEPAVRPLVLHMRGIIAMHLDEDERALAFIEEALRLNPGDAEAHANLGRLLLKSGHNAGALAAYAAALTLQRDNVPAHYGLAKAMMELGLADLAFDAFRDVLARSPAHADAIVDFSALLGDTGRRGEAVAMLRDAVARHPERPELEAALTALTSPAGDEPDGTDATATTAAGMALPRLPADPVVCDALFVDGVRHHGARDYQRSRKAFEQVLALDPRHVNTLCNLGGLELGQGNGARALELLECAVALAPALAPAHGALADALLALERIDEAVVHYRKALDLAPGSEAAHAGYARALHRLGDLAGAKAHQEEAGRLTREHYRKALDAAPNNDAVHATYALALRDLGDLDGAMAHFQAAVRIDQRQSPEFYEALGRTCAARGNREGAEISLKHALALNPQLVTAHCALGELYLALGHRVEAGASFRRALEIDPSCAAALRGIGCAPPENLSPPALAAIAK